MNKIIEAINKMIENKKKITSVLESDAVLKEYFFLYSNKHKWSIRSSDEGYFLYYYTSNQPLEYLAAVDDWERDDIKFVLYSSAEIKTKEAFESFRELFQIVLQKFTGIDDILDEIISES